MALIKFGMMMTDARGKLGGQVFTKTRSGATVRTKVTPTNGMTQRQGVVRNNLAYLSKEWSLLTEDQRSSWLGAVESFKRTNVFGDVYAPSGRSLYISVNSNLATVNAAPLKLAPPAGSGTLISSFTVATNPALTEAEVELAVPAVAGDYLIIEATAQNNPGRYNFSGQYRQVGLVSLPAASLGATLDFTEEYSAKFGTPIVGRKISFRGYTINSHTGVASPRLTFDSIVITV